MPAVSRLSARFGDQVDFVHIDWDDPDSQEVIAAFGAPRRSTYFILAPDGQVLWTYVGLLDEEAVAGQLEIALNR